MQFESHRPRNDLSCLACKRLKRKCSRDQPACFLCRKTNRPCRYPDNQPIEDSNQIPELQARIRELEKQLSQSKVSNVQQAELVTPAAGYSILAQSQEAKKFSAEESALGIRQEFSKLVLDSVAFRNSELGLWQNIQSSLSHHSQCPFEASQLEQVIQGHILTTHVWLPIGKLSENLYLSPF